MAINGFSELDCNPLYPKYLAFRHEVFNEHLKYNESGNPVFDLHTFTAAPLDLDVNSPSAVREFNVEYDHYDIPKAIHLAYTQNQHMAVPRLIKSEYSNYFDSQKILGCLRLLPTDGSYMIKDNIERGVWKNVELIEDLPCQPDIYEASRIAVALNLRRNDGLREVILDNLVYANIELAVRLGIKKMVGIMYDRVWKSVYKNRGVPITYISNPFCVDNGLPIIIGEIDTSEEVLSELKRRYSQCIDQGLITPPILETATWLTHYYHVNRRLPFHHSMQATNIQGKYAV